MPLPTSNTAWPPIQFQKAYEQFAVDDAWYTSDEEALEWLYAVNRLQTKTSIWGQVKRFFWGSPTPMTSTQRPVKMHVPVAAEVSRMSSQILFGQMPEVGFNEPETAKPTGKTEPDPDAPAKPKTPLQIATERLTEILDDSAHATLLQGAEYASAHGGVYVKVTWDQDIVPDKPFLETIASDAAVPTFRSGRLVEVNFWRELAPLTGSNQVFKLVENHSIGRISWGLYAASADNELGIVVPLTDHPDVAYLADIVDGEAGIDTGSDLLTAVYVPNIAPNGAWRKFPGMSALGRSDYAGAEDMFDDLDETYTSMQRDFRLGRARMLVPKGLLNTGTPGQGSIFDSNQEIFVEAGQQVGSYNPTAATGSADAFFQYFQPNIRTTEHLAKIVHLLSRIYQACGFSPQSFGDAGEVAVTATEVTAREKLTMLTRQAKILYWRPQLQAIFAALMDVDEFAFNGPGRGGELPDIEWTDAAAQDPLVLAQTLSALNTSESASIWTRVQMLHEDWDDDQIGEEVARIREDYSMLPDPTQQALWAAQSETGSTSGGVAFTSAGGVVGSDQPGVPPAVAPDQTASGAEKPAPAFPAK